jgi:hypothetical protein
MKMEYTNSSLDGIIRMLQIIRKDRGDLPVLVKYKKELLFLTSCMVMGEENNLGVVIQVDDKPFKLEMASNETH